jgi:predicted aspartyl protease
MIAAAAIAALFALAPTGASGAMRAPPAPPEAQPVPPSDAEVVMALGSIENRMTVPVSIGDSATYPFVIDTGAERTVISRELANVLTLPPGPTVRLVSMTGISEVASSILPSIMAGSVRRGAIIAPTLSGSNLGAVGMLGIDALQSKQVAIDFEHNVMTVRPSERHGSGVHAEPGDIVVRAVRRMGQLIVTKAYYGSKRIDVIVDTGSAVTIGNSAFRHLVSNASHSDRMIQIQSVTGGFLTVDYAIVNRVRIGGVHLNRLPVAFADAPPFAHFGLSDTPALLLGMDAMRAFRGVTIDFANREVLFSMPDSSVPAVGQWSVVRGM